MRDRKFNNEELGDNYPEPGVPADEGWAAMNKLLDAGPGGPPSTPPKPKMRFGGHNFFIAAAVLVASVVVILLMKQRTETRDTKGESAFATRVDSNEVGMKAREIEKSTTGKARESNNIEYKGDSASVAAVSSIQIQQAINQSKGESEEIGEEVDGGRRDITGGVKGNTSTGDGNRARDNNSNVAADKINAAVTGSGKNAIPPGTKSQGAGNKGIKDESKSSGVRTGNQLPSRGKPVRADVTTRGREGFSVHNADVVKAGEEQATAPDDKDDANTTRALGVSDDYLPAASTSFGLGAFVSSRAKISVDSSLFEKLWDAAGGAVATTKESKKREKLFDFGLQWDLPVPVQGTKNYFKGTNAKSNPLNLLVPQAWVSVALSRKSNILLSLNFNQQFFIDNEKVAERAYFMAPVDTGTDRTSIYKTGGFGATFEYNRQLYNNWHVAVGINYARNRTALLEKQTFSAFSGATIADSLYGINRQSAEWQYINNNLFSAMGGIYYNLNKIDIGASATVPLGTIPVFGNKKIHPANVQVFVRWHFRKR